MNRHDIPEDGKVRISRAFPQDGLAGRHVRVLSPRKPAVVGTDGYVQVEVLDPVYIHIDDLEAMR